MKRIEEVNLLISAWLANLMDDNFLGRMERSLFYFLLALAVLIDYDLMQNKTNLISYG